MQAKCLCNNSAKAEMFSLKKALAAIKDAYDLDMDGVRAYITDTLGIKAKTLKDLKWQDLESFAKAGKTGRYSTWSALNGLKAWFEKEGESEQNKQAAKARIAKKAKRAAKTAAKAKTAKAA